MRLTDYRLCKILLVETRTHSFTPMYSIRCVPWRCWGVFVAYRRTRYPFIWPSGWLNDGRVLKKSSINDDRWWWPTRIIYRKTRISTLFCKIFLHCMWLYLYIVILWRWNRNTIKICCYWYDEHWDFITYATNNNLMILVRNFKRRVRFWVTL